MKNHLATVALLGAAALGLHPSPAAAQDAKTLRVGVFDSRAVALAYARSAEFMRGMQNLGAEFEKAKAEKNDQRVKELEQEGQWTQVRLHQQAFSDGPVSSILAAVKDRLPAIAAQAGVSIIVSKWAMPFQAAAVETVDVTLPIVKLFNPTPETLTIIDQMKSKAPIPFEKLGLDPND